MPDDPESTANNRNEASPPLDSTFDLIERARGGDSEAIERLLARHIGPLRRWVSGRLPRWARDLADTDDLVQDTLLRTFRKIEDFEARGVGALQAYLRQAVLNRVRDELRRKARSPQQVDGDGLDLEAGGSPLEEAIGREAFERYEAALARLKPEEREAIIGRVEMEYSYEELADALGKPSPVSVGTLSDGLPITAIDGRNGRAQKSSRRVGRDVAFIALAPARTTAARTV